MPESFPAMRQRLVDGGLVCGSSLKLTQAGHAHVDQLLRELPLLREDGPAPRGITWQHHFTQRRRPLRASP